MGLLEGEGGGERGVVRGGCRELVPVAVGSNQ